MLFAIPVLRLRQIIFCLILLSAVGFDARLRAQTKSSAPSNRWLLIVETSRAMQHHAENTWQLAASLITGGMNGQMRRGDTLGLWTFNESLFRGQFPLQDWTPENNRAIGGHVYEFLQKLKNEKEARLEKVIPEMEEVIKASEFITIVLISEGTSPMRGTPFDSQINAGYKEWQAQQKKNQMPFITVLRAKHGTITDYVLNTPPFPLELPALPDELTPRVEIKAVEPEKPKPVVVPPLILSGKKPERQTTIQTSPTEILVKPESAPVTPAKPETPSAPQPQPEAVVEAHPLINPAPAATPPPQTVAKSEVAQTPPVPAKTETSLAKAEPPLQASPEKPAVEIQTATAPSQPISHRKGVWIATAVIFALMLIGTFFVLRRPRHSSDASLITRSLNRDQK